jgi:hypothetical protein
MTEEALIWKARYESLKKWVENNMQQEYTHPWYEYTRTVDEPSPGHRRKDMDLL